MEIITVIGGIVDLIGKAIEGAFGMRYVLSPQYRAKVHARWRGERRIVMISDILTFGMSFILLAAIVLATLWSLAKG
jgi:hypothetical protein